MVNRYISLLLILSTVGLISEAQPYVVNEKVVKVFSEGFTDINKSFIITSSSDPKFWATYGDGYYYMQRKIAAPRAIIANADPITKNFYIKTKILLAPLGILESSVGVIFLAQKGGKGGFVFEFNRKRKFRVKDLGTGAFITKEGENGWVKSKVISPPTRNNTVEIKGFRGKFDIYVNGNYIYSFVNGSYEKGKFGAYIGPNTEAKIYYYNVYNLEIPGIAPEINLSNLTQQIERLKQENDSLKTIALTAVYGDSDKTAISAIKILEKQLQAVNEENTQIKKALEDFESAALKSLKYPDTINLNTSNELIKKLEIVRFERDSILEDFNALEKYSQYYKLINDSLNNEVLENKTKIGFMNEELSAIRLEIAESKLTIYDDSLNSYKIITASDSLKIDSLPERPQDSGESEFLDTINYQKTDISYDSLPKPAEPSEIVLIPQFHKLKSDAINNEAQELENIDSVLNSQKTTFLPSLIINEPSEIIIDDSLKAKTLDSSTKLLDSASKPTLILESLEKLNSSLIDSTIEKPIDSSLVKDIETAPSALDSVTPKSEIINPIIIDTVGAIELVKKDSIYIHTLDFDSEIGIDEEKDNGSKTIDSTNSEKTPFKKLKIKIMKGKKD